jgi:hypothetical protein
MGSGFPYRHSTEEEKYLKNCSFCESRSICSEAHYQITNLLVYTPENGRPSNFPRYINNSQMDGQPLNSYIAF